MEVGHRLGPPGERNSFIHLAYYVHRRLLAPPHKDVVAFMLLL